MYVAICFLYSIKIFRGKCSDHGVMSDIERGIYHVIQRAKITGRRSVISLGFSLAIPGLYEAVRNAISNNVVVVSSAGND